MYNNLRLGILGGSFNPPHMGHVHISDLAIKKLKLDKMLWMVSPGNPLKDHSELDDFQNRINKCENITKGFNKIEVSDLEKKLNGKGNNKKYYSYDFIKKLKIRSPNTKIFFIIGADNFVNFHKWYKYQELSELCHIVILDRNNLRYKALKSRAAQSLKNNYTYLRAKEINISSTEIRRNITTKH